MRARDVRAARRVGFLAALLGWFCLWASSHVAGQEKPEAKVEAASSPAALTAYADAANYQNKMAYALAAEEWQRFLQRFGHDPLAAKAEHYRGVCLVQLKEYAEAVKAFESVLAKHPQFELREEAYLNLGWSQYSLALAGDQNRYAQAAETFGKLQTEFPQGKYVDQALFFGAESLYALDRRKDAAMAYGKLVTGFAESKMRADALYALGVTLEEMSQWEQAAKAYEMLVQDYAQNPLATEVRMRLAETWLQRGEAQRAESLFAEVAGVEGFASADHALMRQAYCAAQQDKNGDAARLYAAVVERFKQSPHVPEATLSAARCHYRAQQWDEAVQWLDRVLAAGGAGAAEAAHWRCRIHLRNKEVERALQLADEQLATAGDDPYAPQLRLDKADALYETPGRQAEALRDYVALADAHSAHEVGPIALYNAALAAMELKQFDQATALAGRFLAEQPEHSLTADARYVVAECKLQIKEHGESETIYRQLIESAPEHPDLPLWRVRLGLVLYLQQKYSQALELLTPELPRLQVAAMKAEALFLIGLSKFQLGEWEAAAAALREAMSADATWRQADETLLHLARAQRQMNQLSDAITTLGQLIESFPQSALLDQAYYHLGESHYAAARYPDAIAAYDEVLQRYGQTASVPFALYGKGWSRMKAGEFEPAISAFTALIEQHADHALRDDGLLARGMCYRQAGQYPAAIADMDKYLGNRADSPQRADALYERGLSQALAQQYDQAVKTYRDLVQQYPDYVHADKVWYELAWAYKSLPDAAAAVKAFAALGERCPASPLAAEAHFHVGEAAYAQKNYGEAAEAYQRAAEAANPVLQEKVVYKWGWSHYQLQQYRDALARFEGLLLSHADGELAADARFMKAECLLQLKDYQRALPAYKEAMECEASSPQTAALRQLHAAQAARELEKWSESIQLLDSLIAGQPDSHYAAEAYFERAQAKRKLSQLDEAIRDYQMAAEKSRGTVGARAMFMIGEIQFQQRRYDDAVKNFQRTMFRDPASEEASAELRHWQAQAGYEAGRCCEIQIADAPSPALSAKRIEDAKKFYQYVVESHADHQVAAEATLRLAALAKLTP